MPSTVYTDLLLDLASGDSVMELYDKFSFPDKMCVGYKEGIHEKLLLEKLSIPDLDLEDFDCPKFEGIISEERKRRFTLT